MGGMDTPETPTPEPPKKKKWAKPKGCRRNRRRNIAKDQAVVLAVMEGQTPVEALIEKGGYAPSTARDIAYRFFERPHIKSMMTEAMEAVGINMQLAALRIREALDARMVSQTKKGLQLTDIPDHRTRMLAVDRITDAYGLIPTKSEVPQAATPGLTVNIVASSKGDAPTIVAKDSTPTEPLTLNIKSE